MTEAQAIELIDAAFVAAWPVASGGLPLVLENEALSTAPSFGMLTIKHTVSQQISQGGTGTRRFERRGWIYVKLWVSTDVGRKGFSALADAVRGILEAQSLSSPPGEPVTIDAGLTQEIGVGPDGAYYTGVVQLPFRFYATI